jgi:hypothetical protein
MAMLKYRDFVPRMISRPGLLNPGEYESFDYALDAANDWIAQENIQVRNIETVVLPNIWSRWEEGSTDTSLGTSGGAPSTWHQFIRCWYEIETAHEKARNAGKVGFEK